MTQVDQTTARVTMQTRPSPTPNVVVNKEFGRGSDPAVADWMTAVSNQGRPSIAQRRSPILG